MKILKYISWIFFLELIALMTIGSVQEIQNGSLLSAFVGLVLTGIFAVVSVLGFIELEETHEEDSRIS